MYRLEDVVHTPLVTIPAGATLCEAASLLSRTDQSGAPVVDESGVMVGFLEERDLARVLGEDLAEVSPVADPEWSTEDEDLVVGLDPGIDLVVEEVMSPPVPVLDGATGVAEAAGRMLAAGRGHLVVTRGGRFRGVVTAMDLLGATLPAARVATLAVAA